MQNKVQLKEEELVGNEVVLTDIMPNTDTDSVNDNSSGESLDVTLEHMWEAINNKLSRVVNSVNGRSGIVEMDASDVGLGNVDNISFAEIKQWMIDRLAAEFYAHRPALFDSLNEVNEVVSNNDRTYENRMFYTFRGFHGRQSDEATADVDDNLAYIGFFRYNYGTQQMEIVYKAIKVVGKTDQSLTYSTDENDGGLLKVHIHKDEKALYLEEGLNEETSGLRIRKQYLGGKVYMFYGAYYLTSLEIMSLKLPYSCTFNTPTSKYPFDSTASLRETWASGFLVDPSSANAGPKVALLINGHELSTGSCRLLSDYEDMFIDNDTIICYFNPYVDSTTNQMMVDKDDKELILRQPAIGTCKWITRSGDKTLSIIFNSLATPYATWGIGYADTHHVSVSSDSQLTVQFPEFVTDSDPNVKPSVSPINVISRTDQYNIDSSASMGDPPVTPDEKLTYVITPTGPKQMYDTASSRKGGMFLQTDFSLCVMPIASYGAAKASADTSKIASNWGITTPHPDINNGYAGFMHRSTFLGVNLAKAKITENSESKFIPLSGLVTLGSRDGLGSDNKQNTIFPKTEEDIFKSLGLYWSDSADNKDRQRLTDLGISFADDNDDITLSGGLQVNVGNCLEIFPDEIPENAKEYYQRGKVNVRLGNGLKNDGENRITLNIAEDGGIEVDEENGEIYCNIGAASLNAFKLDDMEGHSFFYNPSAKSSSGPPKNCTYLHLGPGLVIGTEELPKPATSVYIMLNEKPEGWEQTYRTYFIKSNNAYVHITDETAPEFVQNRFYRISTMIVDISFPVLTNRPEDWDTDWQNYYEEDESGKIVPITSDTAPEFVANKYYQKTYTARIPEEENQQP